MSENKIRLVAVDLDGTLLKSPVAIVPQRAEKSLLSLTATTKYEMAPEGARLLKAAARHGVHVILATSRVIDSVRILCRSLELTSPVICSNGAQIFSSMDGPLWNVISFPKEIGLEIAKLADANGWELNITVGSVTCYKQRPGQTLGPFAPGRAIVATNCDAVTGDLIRILVVEPEAISTITSLCESKFSDRCRIELHTAPDGKSLGIFGLGANKGNALDLVLKRLGINESEVISIGDDLNDLSLFSRARIKVAMGNAQEELKKQATVIAPGNDDEGVAWALKQFNILPLTD
jgi:Cof subfamily protein (haloacid dehalogenase superfamily)